MSEEGRNEIYLIDLRRASRRREMGLWPCNLLVDTNELVPELNEGKD